MSTLVGGMCSIYICCHMALVLAFIYICIYIIFLIFQRFCPFIYYIYFSLALKRQVETVNGASI